jgi:hypothetical protein
MGIVENVKIFVFTLPAKTTDSAYLQMLDKTCLNYADSDKQTLFMRLL